MVARHTERHPTLTHHFISLGYAKELKQSKCGSAKSQMIVVALFCASALNSGVRADWLIETATKNFILAHILEHSLHRKNKV